MKGQPGVVLKILVNPWVLERLRELSADRRSEGKPMHFASHGALVEEAIAFRFGREQYEDLPPVKSRAMASGGNR